MAKPTHKPFTSLTLLATTVPAPSRDLSSTAMRSPSSSFQRFKAILGFARRDAHALLVGQRLDQRNAGDRVGIAQRSAAQIDQRGQLLGALDGPRFRLERAKGLQPGDDGAEQQQRQKEKVRQKRLKPRRGRISSGAGAVSSGAGLVMSIFKLLPSIAMDIPAHSLQLQ